MPFPIGKTETKPILIRLRLLFETPQNQEMRQPPNRAKTPTFASPRQPAKKLQKKLRFLEKKIAALHLDF